MLRIDGWGTHGEGQRHAFREQSSSDEGQALRGDPVQPLSIVQQTEQRPLLRRLGQHAEDGQSHHEPVRGSPAPQAECDSQGLPLRAGKSIDVAHQRYAQLVQTREGKLHLGFDAGSPKYAKA